MANLFDKYYQTDPTSVDEVPSVDPEISIDETPSVDPGLSLDEPTGGNPFAQYYPEVPAPEAPVSAPEEETSITGRIASAGREFMQGVGQPIASIPKAAALAFEGAGSGVLEDFDEIDRSPDAPYIPQITKPLANEYFEASPERRIEMRQEHTGRQADVVLKSKLYSAGKAIDDFFKEQFPSDPLYQGDFWSAKVPNALGQTVPIIAEVLAARKLSPKSAKTAVGLAVGATQGAAMNAPTVFEDALRSGADLDTALDASGIGAIVGLSEAVPISRLLTRIDKASGGVVKRAMSNMLIQGTEEAAQEAFVEIMNAGIARNFYDPDRGWLGTAGEAAQVGGATGAILGILTALLPGRQRGPSPEQAALDNLDAVEQAARDESEQAGGDALDQAEAATNARGEAEANLPDTSGDAAAAAAAEEAFDGSPEGRVLVLEEELLAENNEATAKRIARQRAIQRLTDAGVEIQPGTALEAAILEEQEAVAAQEQEAQATAEEAEARRVVSQEATQARLDADQQDATRQAEEDAARAEVQAEAAIRYEKGVGVKRAVDETIPEVIAGEEAEALGREFSGEPATKQPINPAMREALQKAGVETVAQIDTAANEAQTSPLNDLPDPSQPQIEAGNYQKGHVNLQGLSISIENPKGSLRKSKPGAAKPWSQEMKHHYGYIRRTIGADGDQIDTFIGEDLDSQNVYVVDQIDQSTGNFDEHKVMIGFSSPSAARRGYLQNYEAGWKAGPITQMTNTGFKSWLNTADTKQPVNTATPVGTISEAMVSETAPQKGMRARQGEPVTTAKAVSVQEEVKRIQKALPNIKATVVPTVNDLPANLVSEARSRTGVRALYDVGTDRVYVVADQHATAAEVEKTMLHEGVAHKGLRYVMGSGELANMLDSVVKSANLSEVATKYKLDLSNTAQAQEAAEEYIAQLAESGSKQGVIRKVIAAVRSALRKAGIVGTWSDNDIKALLREAHKEMAGTPAQRVMLSVQAETEDGATTEQSADVVLRQHDKRMNVLQQLRKCIG